MPTYQDIIDSFVNGQYTQAFNQFSKLGEWEMAGFTADLKSDPSTKPEDKVTYLAYLLDRLVSEGQK